MRIGNKHFPVGHTAIMAILNVTPDSFSDGGSYHDLSDVRVRVRQMIEEGAEIIDVGGESTRPGYQQISDQEEIERILPVIRMIKQEFDIPVSVDTYKSKVAEAALEAGADLINDIWGLQYDPEMAVVIAKYEASCCLMHNRKAIDYVDFMTDCLSDMEKIIQTAKAAGIKDEKIMLDPGVGFAKTLEHNLDVMAHLKDFGRLGYPVLLGTSRKSMIGLTLDLPVSERVEGTLATSVMAVMAGCQFVRVHDIKENARAIKMTEAILGRL